MRKILNKLKNSDSQIYGQEVVKKFTLNPEFPWLVSYPRTGSHWLRMLMELYFGKPSLVRSFFYHNSVDFTCYHQHDEDLSITGLNSVIYLYRNPVDTIYSQLNYYKCDINHVDDVNKYLRVYKKHLEKWLLDESFTYKKVIISYDKLKEDIFSEFSKLVNFYSEKFEHSKLEKTVSSVSKRVLHQKTKHDPQVVNVSINYDLQRENFKTQFANMIDDYVFERKELRDFF